MKEFISYGLLWIGLCLFSGCGSVGTKERASEEKKKQEYLLEEQVGDAAEARVEHIFDQKESKKESDARKENSCRQQEGLECYTGPKGSDGQGSCKKGKLVCMNGKNLVCQGEVLPSKELCDGKDNDCNGQVDEGFTVGKVCFVGIGECKGEGIFTCDRSGTKVRCDAVEEPAKKEICDGLDNDCDGQVDAFLQRNCYTGIAGTVGKGICRSGKQTCITGKWGACIGEVRPEPSPSANLAEKCDGLDNNCDGKTDEGCSCRDGDTQPCGVNTGRCKQGKQTCKQGTWGTCLGQIIASPETCDGLDNDCDGQVDEDFVSLGKTCSLGVGVCKSSGKFVCTAGGLGVVCSARVGTPSAEVCDGKDNDCDGHIDETSGLSCFDGPGFQKGVGNCQVGRYLCKDGAIDRSVCIGQVLSKTEVCDGKDNDCDGQTDEGVDELCFGGEPSLAGKGVCRQGKYICKNGAIDRSVCVGEVLPSVEVCDGKDNDCDGSIDDSAQKVDTVCSQDGILSKLNLCRAGKLVCEKKLIDAPRVWAVGKLHEAQFGEGDKNIFYVVENGHAIQFVEWDFLSRGFLVERGLMKKSSSLDRVEAVSMSSDRAFLAYVLDGFMYLLDGQTNKQVTKVNLAKSRFFSRGLFSQAKIFFPKKGKHVVVLGMYKDYQRVVGYHLRIFGTDGALLFESKSTRTSSSFPRTALFSDDGGSFYFDRGYSEGVVRIDITSKKETKLGSLPGDISQVRSGGTEYLFCRGHQQVVLWDAVKNKAIRSIFTSVDECEMGRNWEKIYYRTHDRFFVYDIKTGVETLLYQSKVGLEPPFRVASKHILFRENGALQVFDLSLKKVSASKVVYAPSSKGFYFQPNHSVFLLQGDALWKGSSRTGDVYQTALPKDTRVFHGREQTSTLLTGECYSFAIRKWSDLSRVASITLSNEGTKCWEAKVSDDGKLFAFSHESKSSVLLYDATGKKLQEIKTVSAPLSFALNKEGTKLAIGLKGKIEVLTLPQGVVEKTIPLEWWDHQPGFIKFGRAGKQLVFWEIGTESLLKVVSLQNQQTVFKRKLRDPLISLFLTSSGKRMYFNTRYGAVFYTDILSGQTTQLFSAHGDVISLSSDDKVLFVGGDRTISSSSSGRTKDIFFLFYYLP